ncbi:MAG TPA: hypothetical protein VMW36_02965 [Patescibacteria group bacterium]|nr:hypothetical protein [Patescibacteria group bacterium]
MISLSSEVEQVVTDLTRNRRLFSAHDVTKLLRDKLSGERIRHNDVKKEVHSMYDNDDLGIYTRTQVTLNDGSSPFVYHLPHHDPNTDYDSDWAVNQIQGNQPLSVDPMTGAVLNSNTPNPHSFHAVGRQINTPSPSTTPYTGPFTVTPPVSVSSDGFKQRKVTVEGRLQIPSKMLDVLGDVAYVRVDQVQKQGGTVDALIISTNPFNAVTSYSLNSDNRIRISNKFLSKIGGNGTYSVKSTKDSVVVVAD